MGKGDKKTAKGKRVMGSYGNSRKRKESKPVVLVTKKEKPNAEEVKAEVKEVKPKAAAKPKAEKKPAEKKATAKKTTAKKTEE